MTYVYPLTSYFKRTKVKCTIETLCLTFFTCNAYYNICGHILVSVNFKNLKWSSNCLFLTNSICKLNSQVQCYSFSSNSVSSRSWLAQTKICSTKQVYKFHVKFSASLYWIA